MTDTAETMVVRVAKIITPSAFDETPIDDPSWRNHDRVKAIEKARAIIAAMAVAPAPAKLYVNTILGNHPDDPKGAILASIVLRETVRAALTEKPE